MVKTEGRRRVPALITAVWLGLGMAVLWPSGLPAKLQAAISEDSTYGPGKLLVSNEQSGLALTPSGKPALLDPEGLLPEDAAKRVADRASKIGKEYGVNIVAAILSVDTGRTPMQNADDLIEYNGYKPDAVLGLINLYRPQRGVWISSTGKMQKVFTDKRCETIARSVTRRSADEMIGGEYENAFNVMLDGISARLGDTRPQLKPLDIAFAFGAALIFFLIYYFVNKAAYRKPKNAERKINMRTQAKADYTAISDKLVDQHTTHAAVSSSSGGGGGGGGHIGSGGTSFSGGGSGF